MRRVLLILPLVVVLGAGCAGAGPSKKARAAEARAVKIVESWRGNLRERALADPRTHFLNLSRATLVARLRHAAARYDFQVVKLELLHPRQSAPLIVIRATNKSVLSSSTPAILKRIDPKARTNDDRTGWAYEGFLFEALDSHGVPFLIAFNHWRGPNGGSGQWASKRSLYPFATSSGFPSGFPGGAGAG
jgi:hypothetical protein